MKKLVSLLLVIVALLTVLTACAQKDPTSENQITPLKIGVLSGTTGMGAAKLVNDIKAGGEEISKYYASIDTYTDPSTLLSDIISGKVDIAALPTNAAATLFNKSKGNAQVVAINTLGVLYVLDSSGSVKSLSDLSGKTVYVATPGQTPEYIFKHIIEKNNIENVTISYDYTDLDSLTSAVATGAVEIALLPEPKVTIAQTTAANNGIANLAVAIDLTEEWSKVEDTVLTQGCVVARKETVDNNNAALEKFLADYEASISYITDKNNIDAAADAIAASGIIPKAPIAKKALPKCNITFIAGEEMKAALSSFLKVLYDMDKTAVGGNLPTDDFYYISK
ncbi:MAG: ABC transporter substrate-binding protein [Ruminococcaceae bacterium]|nr:ABC transporter substrate-binding protein [Oscillospiraceae bacterium]